MRNLHDPEVQTERGWSWRTLESALKDRVSYLCYGTFKIKVMRAEDELMDKWTLN